MTTSLCAMWSLILVQTSHSCTGQSQMAVITPMCMFVGVCLSLFKFLWPSCIRFWSQCTIRKELSYSFGFVRGSLCLCLSFSGHMTWINKTFWPCFLPWTHQSTIDIQTTKNMVSMPFSKHEKKIQKRMDEQKPSHCHKKHVIFAESS